jgi:multiple sugar transport system substrate-binding protein
VVASTKQYPGQIRVAWEARSLKDFGDAPVDELAEQYDLLIVDHPHAGAIAASRCLLPLDEYIHVDTLYTLALQSAGPSHASYYYAGHQWALAVDAAMQTSACRPDLLDEPLPQNWEAVIALGQRLPTRGRYIGMPLVPTDCICSFLSLCASLGDPPGQNRQLVPRATGTQALTLLHRILAVAHPGSLTWNPIQILDHMSSSHEVAYCPLTFCYSNYARTGYKKHIIHFHNMPGVRGAILGGTGIAVSAKCPYPVEAAAYCAWLCSAEVQRTVYFEAGGQPGNIRAWTDSAANAQTHDFFTNTLDTLRQSYVRPRHAGYVAFQEQAGHVIHTFLRSGTSPESCLDELETLFQQSLANSLA